MKYSIVISLLVLAGCASKKPVVVHMNHDVPGTVIPSDEAESVRYGENLKAYTIGRYVEPDNPLVMHERHTVYRVETTAKWNLHPNAPVGVAMGPAVGIVDSAHRNPPVNAEIISEINRQRSLTQTVISEQQHLDQTLGKLSGVVAATQQTAIQSAQVKQQNEDNTRRIELLEKQLREQPVPTAVPSTNDNSNW